MKFSLSAASADSWGSAAGRTAKAVRGTLDIEGATAFWQSHDDESEHLTLVFRGQAAKPAEISFERDVSIKLYGMSAKEALEAAARFVAYAATLEERQRETAAARDGEAIWTALEEVPTSRPEERAAILAELRRAVSALDEAALQPALAR